MDSIKNKLKFFKKCDIFGYQIALRMKNDDYYKTVFGGILTFLIILFFICVTFYSFYMLFTRQTVQTNKYDINLGTKFGNLNISDQNYMIAIRFDADILNNWTNPFMNVTMRHVSQYRNTTSLWKIKTPIDLKICEKTDFPGLEEQFNQLALNTSLCPVPGTPMLLAGTYQEDLFAYFQIMLTTCSADSCQDNATIYNTISQIGNIFNKFDKN